MSAKITVEEARERVLFLSAGLAMPTEAIIARWPEWHAAREVARMRDRHDRTSLLFWEVHFANPAYHALAVPGVCPPREQPK